MIARGYSCTMRRPSAVCGWVLLLFVVGCGQQRGPTRYDLSGSVTYRGQPVPAGWIFLDPDSSRGNSGPGSVGTIRDGRYETAPGKGTVGGPHVATVNGRDGVPNGEIPGGLPLFAPYSMKIDLPKESSTYDFNGP